MFNCGDNYDRKTACLRTKNWREILMLFHVVLEKMSQPLFRPETESRCISDF